MLIVALSRSADHDCPVVEVHGELDAFNCGLLVDTLEQTVAWDGPAVIVDLDRVDLFAATGLNVLERATEMAGLLGRQVHVVCRPDRPAARVLRMLDPAQHLPVHPTAELAVRAVGSGHRAG